MALLQISEPGESPDPHARRHAVGIDLGTTHSLVAAVRSGVAECLPDRDGEVILPSAVRYLADGTTRVGREALAGAAEPERRLRCLVLAEPRAVALGSEPVRVGEALVGRVTSGGYGYTVDASVAFAYLPAEHDVGTEVAVEIFGAWVPGVVADEPLFDPDGERIRA